MATWLKLGRRTINLDLVAQVHPRASGKGYVVELLWTPPNGQHLTPEEEDIVVAALETAGMPLPDQWRLDAR